MPAWAEGRRTPPASAATPQAAECCHDPPSSVTPPSVRDKPPEPSHRLLGIGILSSFVSPPVTWPGLTPARCACAHVGRASPRDSKPAGLSLCVLPNLSIRIHRINFRKQDHRFNCYTSVVRPKSSVFA